MIKYITEDIESSSTHRQTHGQGKGIKNLPIRFILSALSILKGILTF